MEVAKMIVTVLYIIITLGLIAVVMFQKGKEAGLSGTIGGAGADSFYGKNKGRTLNGLLEKLTVVLAVLFIAASIVLAVVFK